MHNKETKLFVMATKDANVPEMSPNGDVIIGNGQPRRIVGKVFNSSSNKWEVNTCGVMIHYHPEYVRHIKECSLLPVTIDTAILCGVTWKDLTLTDGVNTNGT